MENLLALPEDEVAGPLIAGELLALVDALRNRTLNPTQCETLQALRMGILAMVDYKLA